MTGEASHDDAGAAATTRGDGTGDVRRLELGDIALHKGGVLPRAVLAWSAWGVLNEDRSNVIVIPAHYTGTHSDAQACFGAGRALDPARHFIVCPDLFGNGFSTSPSNADARAAGADFPLVTIRDNVACQKRVLEKEYGIDRIKLVVGWSMGGCQAYQWAAQYPEMVECILPFCASARVSPHNFVFLEGVKAALQADGTWQQGRYERPPVAGLRAFGRVYAGWAYSQKYYRDGLYRHRGFATVEELLQHWEQDHLRWDANDLLAMLATWQAHDISDCAEFGGDLRRALAAIHARAIVMPCTTDLYFPVADNESEVAAMSQAELRPYTTDYGHSAPREERRGGFDTFLDQAIRDLLETTDG